MLRSCAAPSLSRVTGRYATSNCLSDNSMSSPAQTGAGSPACTVPCGCWLTWRKTRWSLPWLMKAVCRRPSGRVQSRLREAFVMEPTRWRHLPSAALPASSWDLAEIRTATAWILGTLRGSRHRLPRCSNSTHTSSASVFGTVQRTGKLLRSWIAGTTSSGFPPRAMRSR